MADACLEGQAERQARIDEEMETVEALPPVDEAALGPDADYSAALASGEALVFEPEPEEDEETERRERARRAASLEFDEDPDAELDGEAALAEVASTDATLTDGISPRNARATPADGRTPSLRPRAPRHGTRSHSRAGRRGTSLTWARNR